MKKVCPREVQGQGHLVGNINFHDRLFIKNICTCIYRPGIEPKIRGLKIWCWCLFQSSERPPLRDHKCIQHTMPFLTSFSQLPDTQLYGKCLKNQIWMNLKINPGRIDSLKSGSGLKYSRPDMSIMKTAVQRQISIGHNIWYQQKGIVTGNKQAKPV